MCRGLFSEDNPEVILVIDHFEWSLTGRCGEQCRIQILRQGGGGGAGLVIKTLRKGGGGSPQKFFRPFRPQFGLKISGGRPPPDPPLERFDCVKLKLLI